MPAAAGGQAANVTAAGCRLRARENRALYMPRRRVVNVRASVGHVSGINICVFAKWRESRLTTGGFYVTIRGLILPFFTPEGF